MNPRNFAMMFYILDSATTRGKILLGFIDEI
jgi:hypothetical protein